MIDINQTNRAFTCQNFLKKISGGFTLIEIIVVVAVVALVIGFGTTLDFSAIRINNLQAERSTIVSVLQKAHSRAMANMFESAHGVCYIAPNYVIFRGNLCTATNSELIPAKQNIASVSDFVNPAKFPSVVFGQLNGKIAPPLTPYTKEIDIIINDGVKSVSIKINNEGTINW